MAEDNDKMEPGITNEEKLASYLCLSMKNDRDRVIVCILQRIIDGKALDSEEKQTLLAFVREISLREKHRYNGTRA